MTDTIHPGISRAGIHATRLGELGRVHVAHAILGHAQQVARLDDQATADTRDLVARRLDALIEDAGDVAAILADAKGQADRRVEALEVLAERDATPPMADACRRLIDGGLDVIPSTLVDESDADLAFTDVHGSHWRIDPYGRIAVVT